MIFKLGLRSFKIKSIPYREFFFAEKSDIESVEVYQEYFHLFFIPIFPTHKIYLVKKKDGKIYKAPYKITKTLKNKEKIKTPWYSFLFPILIIVALTYFYLPPYYYNWANQSGIKILYSQQHKAMIKHYDEKKENLIQKINHLKKGDFIRINGIKRFSKPFFLKITKIKRDSIYYDIISSKIFIPDNAFNLYKLQKEYPALLNKLKYGNLDFSFKIESQKKVHKKELIHSLAKDYNTYSKKKGFGYPFTENKQNYYIVGIYPEKGPYLLPNGSYRNRNYSKLYIRNIGTPVELTQIINMGSDIKWENKLPLSVSSDTRHHTLTLKTYDFDDSKDSLDVYLILINKKGELFKYELIRKNTKNFEFELKKLD